MYVVISGGGKVGSFLAHTLVRKNHDVAIIEKRPGVLARLAEELPTKVLLIEGDSCNVGYLEEAGVAHADALAAVTGEDDDNLVTCQLGKTSYGVPRVIARVNSPKNERVFRAFGIDAVSSTSIIGRRIEEETTVEDITWLHTLKQSRLAIVEIDLHEGRSRKVTDVPLPSPTVLVAIVRGEKVIVPTGVTTLEGGDRVIAITPIGQEEDLRRTLQGG
ncbi:MAG: TrkA family potassium uptake protein [Deltaproteobacteria bacterium]|nr:TrkA family potassium uptake protein [Deltaproteobacteria bacterium]